MQKESSELNLIKQIRLKFFSRTTAMAAFFLTASRGLAQSNNVGAWNILSFKLNLEKSWSVFAEAQLRSQLFYDQFSYYEAKTGATYSFKKNYSVVLGGGRYVTYSSGDNFKKPFVNREWRIWEQFGMNSYLDRIKFENRYRIEQRWTSNAGFRNRFRYKLNISAPLNKKKIDPGTFFLSTSDELFFTTSTPNYEQNRFFAGAGYEVSKHLTLQSGYLHQLAYSANNTRSHKGYFQLSVLLETNAHKEHHEKTIGGVD
jgi:hypothetical protein